MCGLYLATLKLSYICHIICLQSGTAAAFLNVFYSVIHIKELSFVVKMPKKKGNETICSPQEATQLIFMDSDSEGDEVDLGGNYCEDSDKESGWEPDQEDLRYSK